jgi:WD40 repeat protein
VNEKRWAHIEEVLQQALDLEPGRRATFLDRACDGDVTLRAKVEALLEREIEARSFMESPAVAQFLMQASDRPHQISHYKIEERLGAGGMGEVYKARDEMLGRLVALKILPVEFTSDPERVRRFRQEAFAASRLNHPNIITIFEIVQQEQNHFIAEEYVEGQTLRELLIDPQTRAPRSLSLEKALDIAIQIGQALKAAHTAWIIHRDIKPENVMIRADGLVKVVDFGIAKLGAERGSISNAAPEFHGADPSLTIPGLIMGTASYMSPEQARGEQLDGRTDLFSLGLLLYEMINGSRLYAGSSRTEAIKRGQQSDDVVRQNLKLARISKDLQRILLRALKSNRADRYASATELVEDLVKFKQRLESRTTRRIVGVSALAVLLAFAVVGVAAFLSVNESWEETILRDGHSAAVRRAVFSADGKLLVSVGEDHQVIVWDFLRRMPLKTLTDHTGVVTTVAFSPDGKWFVTGGQDETAILWDAARLEKELTWHDQPAPVTMASFSSDSALLAYATGRVIIVRETKSWTKVREFLRDDIAGYGVLLFLENNRQLADNTGAFWDLSTGAKLADIAEEWRGNWVAQSPDGKRWASLDADGFLNVGDLPHFKNLIRHYAHHDHGRALAYSPDGKLVASGAERVLLWDASTMTRIAPLEYESAVWSVAFSPDGRWLVSTHGDGSILIWDVLNRELNANLREHSGAVRAVAVAADGKHLASASEDHSVILWDAETGRKQAVLTEHKTRSGAVTFSRDGRWIASSDQSGVVVRYDIERKQSKVIAPPLAQASYCVAISPDGRFIATSFYVFDAGTGAVLMSYLTTNWHGVYSAVFSNDGTLLIGANDLGYMVVVDTRTWQLVERQKWSETPLVALSLAPDGNHIVTGEDGKLVRWGTLRPLRQLGVIGQHKARVKAVAFAPDGERVASAGDDKMVALWDVSSRKLLTTIGTHTSPVYGLAFSADGKRLFTGEHDRSVRQYAKHRTLWGFSLD